MNRRTRVLIVVTHPIMSDGLRLTFQREADMEVVGVLASAAQIQRDFAGCKPDIAIVDFQLGGGEGARAVRALRQLSAELPVVVLTCYPGESAKAINPAARVYEVSTSSASATIVDTARRIASQTRTAP